MRNDEKWKLLFCILPLYIIILSIAYTWNVSPSKKIINSPPKATFTIILHHVSFVSSPNCACSEASYNLEVVHAEVCRSWIVIWFCFECITSFVDYHHKIVKNSTHKMSYWFRVFKRGWTRMLAMLAMI